MVSFPVVEELLVQNYRLYPGKGTGRLHISFKSGPWVILGVNGQGKSTLLLLVRHMIVGAVRVKPPGFSGETKSDLLQADQRIFAVRVADGARTATAKITLRLGKVRFEIERRLDNLALVAASATTQKEPLSTEEQLQMCLISAFSVASFADVVRVIDHLVFAFLDSEKYLLWDTASQYEIFRALLLSPAEGMRLRALEGTIVSSDSSGRNLNSVLYGILQRQDRERSRQTKAVDVRAKLARVSADIGKAQERETELQADRERMELRRSDARTRLFRAEREADDAEKAYEGTKFAALRNSLHGATPTQQYVLLRLLSEKNCVVCGSDARKTAAELERRRLASECLVCGAKMPPSPPKRSVRALQISAQEKYNALISARHVLSEARRQFQETEEAHASLIQDLHTAREHIDTLRRQAANLVKQLPREDQLAMSRDSDRIASLRSEVLNFRKERETAEGEIEGLIARMRHEVESIRSKIESRFHQHAGQFFTEHVRLVYAPRHSRIGQLGRSFDFPGFEVDMTSGATDGEFTRRTAENVSLSQRQYLDLLFRIAVMGSVAGGGNMLVVDGPEGSLDAVFAERAGQMFATYADPKKREANTFISACNVVESAFIPTLLRTFKKVERREHFTNLLDLGAPTAALRDLRPEYDKAVASILSAG